MTIPNWLPKIVSVDGEWEKVLRMLYCIFDKDFKQKKLFFNGRIVWWDRRVLEGQYEEGFWHLITRVSHSNNERLFDSRRAERLPWCRPTIDNAFIYITDIKVWDYKERKKIIRTYIWLENLDYVIVLEKRLHEIGEVMFLITAFYVDGDSKRRNLRKKYDNKVS